MKLAIAIASLAAFVSAHGFVGIAAPAPQTTFSPGEQFAVNLERMASEDQSGTNTTVTIGLLSCPDADCDSVDTNSTDIGTTLFSGVSRPRTVPSSSIVVQNFTVAVPEEFPAGPAVLSVQELFNFGSFQKFALPVNVQVSG
ncbi:hypothetical protein C2E23DRAFT_886492 [Lenzites betulinus]|nr:hypothetical protein C2E23DRAFT_886492 [Lenzites betulinus]